MFQYKFKKRDVAPLSIKQPVWLMSAVILVADIREHNGNKRPYQAKCVRQMISIFGAFVLWDQEIYPPYIYLLNQPTNQPTNNDVSVILTYFLMQYVNNVHFKHVDYTQLAC